MDAPRSQDGDQEPGASRRTFLGYVAGALGTFIGTLVGVPALGYLAAPLRSQTAAAWVNLGPLRLFEGGQPKVAAFTLVRRDGWVEVQEARTCWVSQTATGAWVVFNGRCTHLGCAYSWRAEGPLEGQFHCPCHDGVYDRSGEVLAGPPPRALDRLETRVEGDQLWVLFKDFRSGSPTSEAL